MGGMPSLPRTRHRPSRRTAGGRGPIALPTAVDAISERWWRLSPRTRTGLLALLVVLALALVGRGATTSPWGPPREVLVAATDLDAGHRLAPSDLRPARWPARLVPHDALAADALPPDARLVRATTAGAVVTRRHVTAGIAGLLQAGEAAVAVPLDGLPTVTPGDRVDVVASTPDGTGRRLATDAAVLAADPAFLWLAVDADAVDPIAAAGAAGRLTLALRPPRTDGWAQPGG